MSLKSQITIFFCVLHRVAVKCCDLSEESKVSVFTVTELIDEHTELIRRKKYASYIRQFGSVWSVAGTEGGKIFGVVLRHW
jgi:hypothetical protein